MTINTYMCFNRLTTSSNVQFMPHEISPDTTHVFNPPVHRVPTLTLLCVSPAAVGPEVGAATARGVICARLATRFV